MRGSRCICSPGVLPGVAVRDSLSSRLRRREGGKDGVFVPWVPGLVGDSLFLAVRVSLGARPGIAFSRFWVLVRDCLFPSVCGVLVLWVLALEPRAC